MIILLEFPDWSDRKIAEVCGVSHTAVQKIKPQVATVATSEPTTRTGRDGKQYPASKPTRDGWIAPEVMQNNVLTP